jgi:hypothetical protein
MDRLLKIDAAAVLLLRAALNSSRVTVTVSSMTPSSSVTVIVTLLTNLSFQVVVEVGVLRLGGVALITPRVLLLCEGVICQDIPDFLHVRQSRESPALGGQGGAVGRVTPVLLCVA